MVAPVVTVTLGGTDITDRVRGPDGGFSMKYGRGANFDGSGEAPGYAIFVCTNFDKAFNPRNAASPLAAVLKIGQAVRASAVHSAVTYHLFHGFLRRIVPLDGGFAELHCQDALFNNTRRRSDVAASVNRSIRAFREELLDDAGITSGSRSLDNTNGGEASVVYTGADDTVVANALSELNLATGTAHYVRATASGFEYVTLDRTTLQSRASVETWSDADFSQPFAEDLGPFDYSDERINNQQRVEAAARAIESGATVVWTKAQMIASPSTTKTRWASFDDPTFNQVLTYEVASGSGTVTLTPFARSAKIALAAGAGGFHIKNLQISGRRAVVSEVEAGTAEDSASQAAYGVLPGGTISSDYISSEAVAEGLAGWYVFRYKEPRASPAPRYINRFPTQLVRDVGDRITYTAGEHSLSAVQCLIRAFETVVMENGARWETAYQLEEMPAAVNIFTVGGTADQGVGGTAILGY